MRANHRKRRDRDPRRRRRADRPRARRAPRDAGVSTVDLHHVVDGPADAPPLVLGPSLGTSTAMWDPQCRRAGRALPRHPLRPPRPRRLAASRPARTRSPTCGRDVLALLDHLEIERASIGGVSLGGMVAMWLGAHAPERVDRLLLICTAAHLPNGRRGPNARPPCARPAATEAIADAVVERWLTPAYAREHPDVRERLRGLLDRLAARGLRVRAAARSSGWTCATTSARSRRRRWSCRRRRPGHAARAPAPDRRPRSRARGSSPSDAAHLASVELADDVNRADHRPPRSGARMSDDPAYEAGMKVRREVLGDDHVDRAVERDDAVHRAVPGLHHPQRLGRRVDARRARPADAQRDHARRADRARPRGRARAARPRGAPQRPERGRDRRGPAAHGASTPECPAANSAFAIAKRVLADDG